MRDDPVVIGLLERAGAGDQGAWDQLVERYAPLVWSVCRRHRLSDADTDDVGATVWLRLVERLGSIREPAALPGWLATTTRNECLRVLQAGSRQAYVPEERLPDTATAGPEDWLLELERHVTLRAAFADLAERCRALLSLLFADPPVPYEEISARLGMPVGGIGPNRQRCLAALRAHPSMTALAGSKA
ncbi:MAG TPA: sigma-70 family RNA polymerase sigma factor [Mycobacteriales bacterium]|nr:sigma-70 family RNA polymerase sigma factor [Mycobacteriales bacterium]